MQRHFNISSVILANATVSAFVLLRTSIFNFRCYTQREATPAQKLTRKRELPPVTAFCAESYKGHSLMQTSFAELPHALCIYRSIYLGIDPPPPSLHTHTVGYTLCTDACFTMKYFFGSEEFVPVELAVTLL